MGGMKVLVACEFSGRVRDAFRARGHEAYSCDLEPTLSKPNWHIQADALTAAHWENEWDLMVAFPPCTYLSVATNRHYGTPQQDAALEFVRALMGAPIPRIAIENPRGVISTRIRRPDQTVHPYFFGDPYRKLTCLWLKNLPLLAHGRDTWVYPHGGSWVASGNSTGQGGHKRKRIRSLTFPGIALAMAEQWG